jgi:hypothetical protein
MYKTIKFCVEYFALFMDHHIEPPPEAAWTSAVMRHWQGNLTQVMPRPQEHTQRGPSSFAENSFSADD